MLEHNLLTGTPGPAQIVRAFLGHAAGMLPVAHTVWRVSVQGLADTCGVRDELLLVVYMYTRVRQRVQECNGGWRHHLCTDVMQPQLPNASST